MTDFASYSVHQSISQSFSQVSQSVIQITVKTQRQTVHKIQQNMPGNRKLCPKQSTNILFLAHCRTHVVGNPSPTTCSFNPVLNMQIDSPSATLSFPYLFLLLLIYYYSLHYSPPFSLLLAPHTFRFPLF